MANRELILDGLAWAFIEEPVRVAIISAMLVREPGSLTKTRIKEAVKDTSPPYGRGKAICELVETETYRQKRIYDQRQEQQGMFRERQERKARMDTRLNDVFANVFDREPCNPGCHRPSDYYSMTYEARQAWDKREEEEDRGERCQAITHWKEHVVALSTDARNHRRSITTRLRKGEIVKTFLRSDCKDLVQAAISLGGPKVRAAFGRGIRVTTDWVGRKTTIHYIDKREVELPWRSCKFVETVGDYGPVEQLVPTLIQGSVEVIDPSVEPEEEY